MKNTKNIILFICIFFNPIIFTIDTAITPENTIICSDIDEVLIEKSPWTILNLLYRGLMYDPFNIGTYIKAIYHAEKKYTKNAEGQRNPLYDQYGNVINGFTFHLLFHGMNDENLTSYVQLVLESIENSRHFIMGTKKIYEYLKNKKGYTIVFATNNDHVAYQINSDTLGDEFNSLATYVFVAQPGNSNTFLAQLQDFGNRPTTPEIYTKLLHKALTIQPTQKVIHMPGKKPEYEYYHAIEQQFAPDKNIIFIDDQQENVDGFNILQKNNTAIRHGIRFKNPQQLVEEFIKIGVLSEIHDQELIKEIYQPSIMDQILINARNMITFITSKLFKNIEKQT